MPENTILTDTAIIEMLIFEQKRSRNQATCALNTLRLLGYGATERYRMLKDPNNNIHLLSYFGNIWIFLSLVLFFLMLTVYTIMKLTMIFVFNQ
jgi:hypothetical protein